jgi:hypothetical protein
MNRHAQLARAREKKSELDDAVTCNLAPDLLPLWRKIGRTFKGSPHARFEAFTHYIHDNGESIAIEAMQAEADRAVDAFAFGALADEAPRATRAKRPRRAPVVDDVINLDDVPIVVWGDVVYLAA